MISKRITCILYSLNNNKLGCDFYELSLTLMLWCGGWIFDSVIRLLHWSGACRGRWIRARRAIEAARWAIEAPTFFGHSLVVLHHQWRRVQSGRAIPACHGCSHHLLYARMGRSGYDGCGHTQGLAILLERCRGSHANLSRSIVHRL